MLSMINIVLRLKCIFSLWYLLIYFSYDVVVTAGASEILEKFYKLDARVVFSAEGFCWPDKSLAVIPIKYNS